jgi:hypothetical protein
MDLMERSATPIEAAPGQRALFREPSDADRAAGGRSLPHSLPLPAGG